MRRLSLSTFLVAVIIVGLLPARGWSVPGGGCTGLDGGTCGVHADGPAGVFEGLLAVPGSPWVFADAATAGSEPGCGDCVWTVALACPAERLGDPTNCVLPATARLCAADQRLYRVYLSTAAETDVIQGVVCLGGADQPVDVGGRARADVARYLRDVTPPDLEVVTRPADTTLAGLPTYFSGQPPAGLRPTPFGGADVTETITITPVLTRWRWGDGELTGWTDPAGQARHTYASGGTARGSLVTRWGATYTVTYAGVTVGPLTATGRITRQQAFVLPVRTSVPTLVSR